MALSRREFIGGLTVTFASALARRLSAEAADPEFPEGAKVEVSPRSKSKDRLGRVEAQFKVWVPYAQKQGRYGRVVDYVFEALDAESGDVLVKRKTLQDFYTCSEKKAMEEGGRCKFAVADLPAGKSVKFRVTPRNAAGKGGRSLVSDSGFRPAKTCDEAHDYEEIPFVFTCCRGIVRDGRERRSGGRGAVQLREVDMS